MPDSFTELRAHGGPNRPWIAAGVSALAVSLILIALAGAYWYANPQPEAEQVVPATVTVTASPEPLLDDVSGSQPSGTFTGALVSLQDGAKVKAWPAVATFGGGTGSITYPLTGCTAVIARDGTATPLTKQCPAPGGEGRWSVDTRVDGILRLTYFEGDSALVEGELSPGLP